MRGREDGRSRNPGAPLYSAEMSELLTNLLLVGAVIFSLGVIVVFTFKVVAWVVLGLLNLWRKTAKYNPWRRRDTLTVVDRDPSPRVEEAPTDRIRVPLSENHTELISQE